MSEIVPKKLIVKQEILDWFTLLKTTENDSHLMLYTKAVRVLRNDLMYSYSNTYGDIENDTRGNVTVRIKCKTFKFDQNQVYDLLEELE